MAKKDQKFTQFHDESSPEQASQIQFQWRREMKQKRQRTYTIVLISAIAILMIICALVVKLLGALDTPTQYEIDINNPDFYLFSCKFPHIKFMAEKKFATQEIRIARSTGIIYPELSKWLEINVRPNYKVLLIPSEETGVNFIATFTSYYLKQSEGGKLQIVVTSDIFKKMVQENIKIMQNQHGFDRFPIQILSPDSQIFSKDIDLIIVEKNEYYSQLKNVQNTDIIIISPTNNNNIAPKFSGTHRTFEIDKGKKDPRVQGIDILNYGIYESNFEQFDGRINYLVASIKRNSNLPLCNGTTIYQSQLYNGNEAISNVAQFFRNKTFTNTQIVYQQNNTFLAYMLSNFLGSDHTLYVQSSNTAIKAVESSFASKITYFQNRSQIPLSERTYEFIEGQNYQGSTDKNTRTIIRIANKQTADHLHILSGRTMLFSNSTLKGCRYYNNLKQFNGNWQGNQLYLMVYEENYQFGASSWESK